MKRFVGVMLLLFGIIAAPGLVPSVLALSGIVLIFSAEIVKGAKFLVSKL